jgi:hypothetical protein
MAVALPRYTGGNKATILSNRFCLLSADFAVGIDDIMERLAHVHKTLSELKQSLVAAATMGFQEYLAPILPMSFNRDQVYNIFSRHSAVFTNVPGPHEPVRFAGQIRRSDSPVRFAGHKVRELQVGFSNLVPQISLVSYRGLVFGNLCIDMMEIPHRDSIPVHLSRALGILATILDVGIPESIQRHSCKKY